MTAGGGERDSARVVLLCGLAGSGKTTYAQGLEAVGHVRLSIDEEVWSRFGRFGVDYEPARYAELSAIAEEALRGRLVALVEQGRDVVVDFSFWQRAARDRYKRLIEDAGGSWRLIYLKTDQVLLRRRLEDRSRRFDANAAFPITDELLASYAASFEAQELLRSSTHRLPRLFNGDDCAVDGPDWGRYVRPFRTMPRSYLGIWRDTHSG